MKRVKIEVSFEYYEGTPTLIAKLFSSYWVEEAEIGGNKGESAHKFFMGDRIALLKVSEGQWHIEITDNGRSFNYKQNFSQEEGVEIRTVRHYFIEN